MGEGRRRRPALHRSGAPRDRGLAQVGDAARNLFAQGRGRRCSRPARRSARRSRPASCASSPTADELDTFRPGEVLVAALDQPRLGAGDEDRRRDRHRPRRAHLPRRHRRARTRRAGGGRRGNRDERPADRARWSRSSAPMARPARSTTAQFRSRSTRVDVGALAAAEDRDHGQSRQSRPRVPHRDDCRTPASAWRAWSSSSASISACIRWRWCIRSASTPRTAHASTSCARGYASPREFFVRNLGRGRRHDRRGVLSASR